MELGSIHLYPVKGGRAVDLEAADLGPTGLAGDRRWMVVDENGDFVSQRTLPKLALLDARPDPDGLILTYEDMGERFLATPDGERRLRVTVWQSSVDAALADPATNAALSDWLGTAVRLVHMDRVDARFASADHAGPQTPVSFADGYPVLVAGRASLRALNSAIVENGGESVPMSRFRPNLVIDQAEAWAEDGWRTIRVGECVLDLVKPCDRCKVTTIDQQTGREAGTQPLQTLRRLRMSADRDIPGVLFGWNAVPCKTGRLQAGDRVEILETRPTENLVRASARPADRSSRLDRASNGAA